MLQYEPTNEQQRDKWTLASILGRLYKAEELRKAAAPTFRREARQLFPRGCTCLNRTCEYCHVVRSGPEAVEVVA
jgi:hypothetical protein